MDIHPVKTEADYDAALAEIERLWGSAEGTPDGDRLDILLVLVEAYEAKHYPMAPPDPIAAIKFRMEQMNLSDEDLQPLLGSPERVAAVINGRRPLSLSMIRKLHRTLHIPLESLIQERQAPTAPRPAANAGR